MKRILIAAALLLAACGQRANDQQGRGESAPPGEAQVSLTARDPAAEMAICQARFPGERSLCECMQNTIAPEDFSLLMRIAEAELPAATQAEKRQARNAAAQQLAPAFGGAPQLWVHIGRIQQQVQSAC